jgi:hypothetical protein
MTRTALLLAPLPATGANLGDGSSSCGSATGSTASRDSGARRHDGGGSLRLVGLHSVAPSALRHARGVHAAGGGLRLQLASGEGRRWLQGDAA